MSTEDTTAAAATPATHRGTAEVRQPSRALHAVPDPDPDLDGSARPRAREAVNPLSTPSVNPPLLAEGAEDTAPDDAETGTSAGPSPLQRLQAWAHPPTVRAEAAPSWEQLRWRAEAGRHVGDGWSRRAAIGWSVAVAAPVQALAVWLCWIARSPSRTAAALVLWFVVAHLAGGIPVLSWFFPNPLPD